MSSTETKEIIISGFIKKVNCDLKLAAFSAIRAVQNSFSMDDIVSCRLVIIKEKSTSAITSNTRPSLFIVRLCTNTIVNDVIRAKHNFNLLCTRDLDLALLDQNDVPFVMNTKIYFNEVLAKCKYNIFKSLKETAKKLGFKYIWHRKSSFLIKWRDGEKSHIFKTAANLEALASVCMKDRASHTIDSPKSAA